MNKQCNLIQYRWSNKSPARYLQQVDRKVRYVVWTPFRNKLWSEGLNIDAMDLCTGLYRLDIPNNYFVYVFWSFGYYFDHFWYKFYVVNGSDVCHKTYFSYEYNLSPVHGSYMVYTYATEREDMVMWSILKSQCTQNPSGNPFFNYFF